MGESIDKEDWANIGTLAHGLSIALIRVNFEGEKVDVSETSVTFPISEASEMGLPVECEPLPILTGKVKGQEIECSIVGAEKYSDPYTIELTVKDVNPEALALFSGYGSYPPDQDLGDEVNASLMSAIPELRSVIEKCPVEGCTSLLEDFPVLCGMRQLGLIITHLNDFHKWTREAIADWLDARPYYLYFK